MNRMCLLLCLCFHPVRTRMTAPHGQIIFFLFGGFLVVFFAEAVKLTGRSAGEKQSSNGTARSFILSSPTLPPKEPSSALSVLNGRFRLEPTDNKQSTASFSSLLRCSLILAITESNIGKLLRRINFLTVYETLQSIK